MAGEDQLDRGREAYARRAWRDAHAALAASEPLAAGDLERLATAAYMLGRDDDYVAALERAHHAHLHGGERLRAARCAFWISVNLNIRGAASGAAGWIGRARRLVESDPRDCAERGYLQLHHAMELVQRDPDAAIALGADTVAIAERFGDPDLLALAAQDAGILLISAGGVPEGLALLDEAMVAVTAGELSPIVNGLVYCGVIMGCRAAHEPRRAQEWTAALTRWCDAQPDLVSFTGTCRLHRAELMQLHGAWSDALAEAPARGSSPSWRATRALPPRRTTSRASCIASVASWPPPRRRSSPPATAAASRSPGSRCCGSRKVRARRRGRRSGACSARPSARPSAPASSPPASRSCSPRARSTRPATPAPSSSRSPRATPATCSPRRRRRRAARSSSPPATRGPRSSRCGAAA